VEDDLGTMRGFGVWRSLAFVPPSVTRTIASLSGAVLTICKALIVRRCSIGDGLCR
jgi:hypothetical protein